jgi:hypothetical protein
MNSMPSSTEWLDTAHAFVQELKATQEELLAALRGRRSMLYSPSADAAVAIAPLDHSLLERLQDCVQRRADLLRTAAHVGWPAETLRAAAMAQPDSEQRRRLQAALAQAQSLSRQLQLAGMTQWMLAQRSLAHVGQLLEILATGAPQPPTYGNGPVSTARGGLLDQAA